MSRKPCSSNSEHSQSADSTSASGVALPCLAISRLSSEPALTPILIGTWASAAALAISPTLSSKALMLPGLTRTAAHPASMAANTYFGWTCMSALSGMCERGGEPGEGGGSIWRGHGARQDGGAGRRESGDLRHGGIGVRGQGRGQRLHGLGRPAAHRDGVLALPLHDLPGVPPVGQPRW